MEALRKRGGVRTALAKSRYDASDTPAKIVFYAIMMFVLSTAFDVFGTNPISDYLRAVISYLPLVFAAVLIVVIASAIGGGGIKPMTTRWENTFARYDEEKPRMADQLRTVPSVEKQAQQAQPGARRAQQSPPSSADGLAAAGAHCP
jgi:hypothetical protein